MTDALQRARRWTGWPLALLVLVAAVLRGAYLRVTPYTVRQHDVDGHVEYIEYLLKHHAFPPNGGGYSFYHPGLYFLLAAVQWKVLELCGAARSTILASLQAQSTLCELGFALVAIATAKLWIAEMPDTSFGRGAMSRRGVVALFAALILTWPSTVIHGARIGNDDLVYLFFAGSLYFATRWWLQGGRDRDLNLAALCSALGVITKTNALVLFGILGVLVAVRLAKVEKERHVMGYVKRSWVTVALFVVSSAIALGTAVRDELAGNRASLLIGNSGKLSQRVADSLAVGNHAENYLWFDLPTYVNHAFTSPLDDAGGRQWFWNYLFKTGLFGEFRYDSVALWNLGVCLSVLSLGMLAFFLAEPLLAGEWTVAQLPLTLTAGVLVASIAALRMRHPQSCSNDFRYVLPVLTPFVLGYLRGLGLCWERGWRKVARSGAVLGWGFVGLSVGFVVGVAAMGRP